MTNALTATTKARSLSGPKTLYAYTKATLRPTLMGTPALCDACMLARTSGPRPAPTTISTGRSCPAPAPAPAALVPASADDADIPLPVVEDVKLVEAAAALACLSRSVRYTASLYSSYLVASFSKTSYVADSKLSCRQRRKHSTYHTSAISHISPHLLRDTAGYPLMLTDPSP